LIITGVRLVLAVIIPPRRFKSVFSMTSTKYAFAGFGGPDTTTWYLLPVVSIYLHLIDTNTFFYSTHTHIITHGVRTKTVFD